MAVLLTVGCDLHAVTFGGRLWYCSCGTVQRTAYVCGGEDDTFEEEAIVREMTEDCFHSGCSCGQTRNGCDTLGEMFSVRDGEIVDVQCEEDR